MILSIFSKKQHLGCREGYWSLFETEEHLRSTSITLGPSETDANNGKDTIDSYSVYLPESSQLVMLVPNGASFVLDLSDYGTSARRWFVAEPQEIGWIAARFSSYSHLFGTARTREAIDQALVDFPNDEHAFDKDSFVNVRSSPLDRVTWKVVLQALKESATREISHKLTKFTEIYENPKSIVEEWQKEIAYERNVQSARYGHSAQHPDRENHRIALGHRLWWKKA